MGVIGRRQQLVVARRVAIRPQLDAGAVQSCPGQPAVEAHHLLGAPAVGSDHGAGQQAVSVDDELDGFNPVQAELVGQGS